MTKQSPNYGLLSRQIILSYLQEAVFRYEEFADYYNEFKDAFNDLKFNRADAMDFWQEVCDGSI